MLQTDSNSADMDDMYPVYAVFLCTGCKLFMVNGAFLLRNVGGYRWQAAEALDAGAGASVVVLYICYVSDELIKSVRTSWELDGSAGMQRPSENHGAAC